MNSPVSCSVPPDGGLLSIDLNAVAANWVTLSRKAGDAACGAVVKADAYGLGVEPVVKALYEAGCRHFYVALLSEGIALRQWLQNACADETASIYILDGLRPGGERFCHEYRLIPVVFSEQQLRAWAALNQELLADGQVSAPCAIKFNTGMTRLGFEVEELERLQALVMQAQPCLFMSHLACAEQADNPQNALQLERFRAVRDSWLRRVPNLKFSLANSSGIFLGSEYHFDFVRPGAAIYGVNPTSDGDNPMAPVVSLRLPIIQLRAARAGELVGYGGTHQLKDDALLAVVLGGYADGLPRSLGGKAKALVAGVCVPAVGRVSMDSMVFDVSEVKTDLVEGESYAELLGRELSVDGLAQAAGTIGYELLTNLGRRYQREYLLGEEANKNA